MWPVVVLIELLNARPHPFLNAFSARCMQLSPLLASDIDMNNSRLYTTINGTVASQSEIRMEIRRIDLCFDLTLESSCGLLQTSGYKHKVQ